MNIHPTHMNEWRTFNRIILRTRKTTNNSFLNLNKLILPSSGLLRNLSNSSTLTTDNGSHHFTGHQHSTLKTCLFKFCPFWCANLKGLRKIKLTWEGNLVVFEVLDCLRHQTTWSAIQVRSAIVLIHYPQLLLHQLLLRQLLPASYRVSTPWPIPLATAILQFPLRSAPSVRCKYKRLSYV